MDYWGECIEEAFEDANITATKDQIVTVASWVEGAHDNFGMAHGHDCIPNPLQTENDELKRKLEAADEELRKPWCKTCNGKGRIIINGPCHSSDGECWKCNGTGRSWN